VAAALGEIEPDCRISFIGTRRGLEARVVPAQGFPLDFISIGGFLGKGPADRIRFPFQMALSTMQSIRHLRRRKPEAVLGTGGYVCAPPVLAARLLGIPAYLLALDAMPSKAVRMLARHVRRVFAGFPECADHIGQPEKVVYTGNPLRGDLNRHSREEGLGEFGLDPGKKTILVYGGSQGAHSINLNVAGAISAQGGKWSGIQFIFQTGKQDYDLVRNKVAGAPARAIVMPYIEKMSLAFSASDLVISRSGSTVSEILACGLPSILVPYPHAASNHQEHNARSLEKNGAAVVVIDAELTADRISVEIDRIIDNRELLKRMNGKARASAKPGAARDIARRLVEAAGK
jgi:UDP-N-acetylglucosamine--N-acetylmuramyl-(pentapeptide) pyrophosphoryl-undecaprenol N-acetylglucosamine transferase